MYALSRLVDDSSLFRSEMDLSLHSLIQIDKLVQLLESPSFTCKLSQYFLLQYY